MVSLLPFIVNGVAVGAIFGLAATGLVLTYKTSGIFNFGHGALATAAAYVFYWLHVDHEVNWSVAAFVAVLIVGPLMGLLMERIARKLHHQRTSWKVVGTIGLVLIVQGLGVIKYGPDSRRVPQYLPSGNETFRILDVNIRYSQVMVTVVAVLAVVALFALFRVTRLGLSMRAVVDDPDLLDLLGTSAVRVRRTSWFIGSTFAALSGVLILPFVGLESVTLTFLVVQSFGAAAFGRFSSVPLTFLGGIIIGVGESLLTKYEIEYPNILGLSKGFPFIILIIVMLITPKAKLLPPSRYEQRPALQWHGPTSLRLVMGVLVLGILASVPLWGGFKITPYWVTALTFGILMLSLGLMVRTAGIVSLCTGVFVAIGAVAFSHLQDAGVSWIPGLLLAGLVVVPLGALIALPAIRLSGLFLALATLGFGLLVERLLYRRDFMFTASDGGVPVPRPSWASTPEKYYYLVLFILVVCVFAIELIDRGRLGRMLRGMGDSPKALSSLGLTINVTRVIVFCIGAYLAAIAGALHGSMLTVAGAESLVFSSFNSLVLVAILVVQPFRAPWYAIIAGASQVIPGYIEGVNTPHVLTVLFGVFAIFISMRGGPHSMPLGLRKRLESRLGRKGHEVIGASEKAAVLNTSSRGRPSDDPATTGLAVEGVTVRFGGLVAVDDVSLRVPLNRITGLIGPNGAGKTTIFNACSGFNRPTHGRVTLHGEDISRHSTPLRARRGLGRTFQIVELCESLTVFDNVALGREASQAGANPIRQMAATSSEMRLRRQLAEESMALCGIAHLADQQAGALSTGQRRLVELARCLSGPFDVLLLDEPSSGLDAAETVRFGEVLSAVVAQKEAGILLVEHDMELVMKVCEHIYVLDFGAMIFEGPPPAVAASADVQAAYLGVDASAVVGAT